MKIECYLSQGCSSLEELKANIEQALNMSGIKAEMYYYQIGDEEAAELKLAGSPTVLIDGKDIAPGAAPGFS